MLFFIEALQHESGSMPRFGADNGGCAFLLGYPADDNFLALLSAAALIFRHPELHRGEFEKNGWLLSTAQGKPAQAGPRRLFPAGGYAVLESSHEFCRLKLVFKSSPLGYLSLAAHGHADALSFVLGKNGEWLLVAPGTYCYHSNPEWRRYFRSTLAHNTIRIDGQDQSSQGGDFIWHVSCSLPNATAGESYVACKNFGCSLRV